MELTYGTNQKTFNSKQEEIIHPKETGDDLTCNKLEIKTMPRRADMSTLFIGCLISRGGGKAFEN